MISAISIGIQQLLFVPFIENRVVIQFWQKISWFTSHKTRLFQLEHLFPVVLFPCPYSLCSKCPMMPNSFTEGLMDPNLDYINIAPHEHCICVLVLRRYTFDHLLMFPMFPVPKFPRRAIKFTIDIMYDGPVSLNSNVSPVSLFTSYFSQSSYTTPVDGLVPVYFFH